MPQQDNLQVTRSQMGTIRCGPLCSPSQQATGTFLQFLSRPSIQGDRCFSSTMNKPKTVCLPTIHLARENNSQDTAGECEESCGHRPDMDESVMVLLGSLAS